eukprot:5587918-Lingulodinium_polyedra.AAC.1
MVGNGGGRARKQVAATTCKTKCAQRFKKQSAQCQPPRPHANTWITYRAGPGARRGCLNKLDCPRNATPLSNLS